MKQKQSKTVGAVVAATAILIGAGTAMAAFPDDWYMVGMRVFGPELSHAEMSLPAVNRYERLAFVARGADVRCRYIRIEFGNGRSQRLDGDRYNLNHEVRIDLDGDDRRITEIEFRCRSRADAPARLEVFGR